MTHGNPEQGYYGGFWRGDGGRDGEDSGDVCGGVQGFSGKRYITERAVDGEFYAEGVLKMYSFSEKIVIYLRKINSVLRGYRVNGI